MVKQQLMYHQFTLTPFLPILQVPVLTLQGTGLPSKQHGLLIHCGEFRLARINFLAFHVFQF